MNLPKKAQQSTNISPLKAIDNAIIRRGQNGYKQISVYRSQPPATKEELKEEVKRLLLAFPKIEQDVLIIIAERAFEKKMPLQQIVDGINRTIDTCEYPNFTPAKVLNFDINYDIYSYAEACDIWIKNGGNKVSGGGTLLSKIKINNTIAYIKTIDKQRFNIPDAINNEQ